MIPTANVLDLDCRASRQLGGIVANCRWYVAANRFRDEADPQNRCGQILLGDEVQFAEKVSRFPLLEIVFQSGNLYHCESACAVAADLSKSAAENPATNLKILGIGLWGAGRAAHCRRLSQLPAKSG